MNPLRCLILSAGIIPFFLLSCDSNSEDIPSNTVELQPIAERLRADEEPVPETLDAAVTMIMDTLTDEDRQFIISGGEEYEWMLPSHGGMGMRNGWGLWGDSPLSRYFHRLGIYHADDMSGIICQVVSRTVRDVPIKRDEIIQYYRDYWAEQDIVAPLDLGCPHCGKEMRIEYVQPGFSLEHPERAYFSGHCPDALIFYYYHKSGWASEDRKMENKACHTTATSPSVGGVMRGFMTSPPFHHWPSLVAVYAL